MADTAEALKFARSADKEVLERPLGANNLSRLKLKRRRQLPNGVPGQRLLARRDAVLGSGRMTLAHRWGGRRVSGHPLQ
jgi:hypothetical protein